MTQCSWMAFLRLHPPPGDVPQGHPGLTPRVIDAVAKARSHPTVGHLITDDDGPHLHHWEAILWWCRGCGAIDESERP